MNPATFIFNAYDEDNTIGQVIAGLRCCDQSTFLELSGDQESHRFVEHRSPYLSRNGWFGPGWTRTPSSTGSAA
jgi:hypothetical protein